MKSAAEIFRGASPYSALKRTKVRGPSIAGCWPWLVAFAFDHLPGFGFAGALTEIGPQQIANPATLLFFNRGIELSQSFASFWA